MKHRSWVTLCIAFTAFWIIMAATFLSLGTAIPLAIAAAALSFAPVGERHSLGSGKRKNEIR